MLLRASRTPATPRPDRGRRSSTRPLPTLTLALASTLAADSPFAVDVVSFDPGVGGVPGYDQPSAALGEPSRDTGWTWSPETVTPFQPAWLPDQIV